MGVLSMGLDHCCRGNTLKRDKILLPPPLFAPPPAVNNDLLSGRPEIIFARTGSLMIISVSNSAVYSQFTIDFTSKQKPQYSMLLYKETFSIWTEMHGLPRECSRATDQRCRPQTCRGGLLPQTVQMGGLLTDERRIFQYPPSTTYCHWGQ